jgi:1-acyl-sn-glycerol-3-phosphate acyltransferase
MGSLWRHPGRTGAMLYAVLATLVGGIVTVFSRLQIERQRGREHVVSLLPDGPIIVISNHTSYADGPLLALVCRRHGRSLRLLATAGVFRAPLIGRIARKLGFIAVHRGTSSAAASLDAAADALAAGEAVGLFPEGRLTRQSNYWPERAKTGAVRLALRTNAPIVPVAIEGAHRLVGRRRVALTLLGNLVRRPQVLTRVGQPIDVRALLGTSALVEPTPQEIRAVADAVMEQLIDLIEQLRGEVSPHPTGTPTD